MNIDVQHDGITVRMAKNPAQKARITMGSRT